MLKTLEEMVHDKLRAGTLPREDPVKLWVGVGSGALCAVCEHRILPSEPEYEPEFRDAQPATLFHAECHDLWDFERRRLP